MPPPLGEHGHASDVRVGQQPPAADGNALLVLSRALKGNAVWVLEDGRVKRREVRKGVSGSERTEIVSGLAEGEMVVLSPAESLRGGQRAHGVPAAAASTASAKR